MIPLIELQKLIQSFGIENSTGQTTLSDDSLSQAFGLLYAIWKKEYDQGTDAWVRLSLILREEHQDRWDEFRRQCWLKAYRNFLIQLARHRHKSQKWYQLYLTDINNERIRLIKAEIKFILNLLRERNEQFNKSISQDYDEFLDRFNHMLSEGLAQRRIVLQAFQEANLVYREMISVIETNNINALRENQKFFSKLHSNYLVNIDKSSPEYEDLEAQLDQDQETIESIINNYSRESIDIVQQSIQENIDCKQHYMSFSKQNILDLKESAKQVMRLQKKVTLVRQESELLCGQNIASGEEESYLLRLNEVLEDLSTAEQEKAQAAERLLLLKHQYNEATLREFEKLSIRRKEMIVNLNKSRDNKKLALKQFIHSTRYSEAEKKALYRTLCDKIDQNFDNVLRTAESEMSDRVSNVAVMRTGESDQNQPTLDSINRLSAILEAKHDTYINTLKSKMTGSGATPIQDIVHLAGDMQQYFHISALQRDLNLVKMDAFQVRKEMKACMKIAEMRAQTSISALHNDIYGMLEDFYRKEPDKLQEIQYVMEKLLEDLMQLIETHYKQQLMALEDDFDNVHTAEDLEELIKKQYSTEVELFQLQKSLITKTILPKFPDFYTQITSRVQKAVISPQVFQKNMIKDRVIEKTGQRWLESLLQGGQDLCQHMFDHYPYVWQENYNNDLSLQEQFILILKKWESTFNQYYEAEKQKLLKGLSNIESLSELDNFNDNINYRLSDVSDFVEELLNDMQNVSQILVSRADSQETSKGQYHVIKQILDELDRKPLSLVKKNQQRKLCLNKITNALTGETLQARQSDTLFFTKVNRVGNTSAEITREILSTKKYLSEPNFSDQISIESFLDVPKS